MTIKSWLLTGAPASSGVTFYLVYHTAATVFSLYFFYAPVSFPAPLSHLLPLSLAPSLTPFFPSPSSSFSFPSLPPSLAPLSLPLFLPPSSFPLSFYLSFLELRPFSLSGRTWHVTFVEVLSLPTSSKIGFPVFPSGTISLDLIFI